MLKARDKLPRYGRTINNSFSSSVNVTGVCKKLFIQKSLCEDSDVSPLTGKKSKSKTTTVFKGHMLFCDHVAFLKDL